MLFAHLAAGYITTKTLQAPLNITDKKQQKYFYMAGLLFSILPDFDIFYFYLFNSSVHHHKFFPHLPMFWLLIFILWFLIAYLRKRLFFTKIMLLAGANIMVHMLLDSITAPMWWLYPFSEHALMLIEVPARYSHWLISMIFHWSFIFELVIIGTALYIFTKVRLYKS